MNTKTKVIKVRELLKMAPKEILELPKDIIIEFEDDIVLNTTNRKAFYSRQFWIIHEHYPKLPITHRHFVQYILDQDNGTLSSNTHSKLLSIIARDTIELYNLHDPISKEPLLELIYTATNTAYNELDKVTAESVLTIDILDFLKLSYNKEIIEANKSLKPAPRNIDKIHKKVLNLMTTVDPDNNIAKAIKAKVVNVNQLTQCISLRGYLSEVDGKILTTPVMSNFTMGLNKLFDFVAETRSAAKSLHFSKSPLEIAQYFARRLQLMCMYVDKIEYTDCGSTEYVSWLVRPPEYNEQKEKVYNGDLMYMKGKYYLDQATNRLLSIEGDEKHLENTIIRMRSPLKCRLPNKHHICAVCFGKLAENLHAGANLGHVSSATATRQTSQSIVSNKHYQGSTITTELVLSSLLLTYFNIGSDKSSLTLNSRLKGSKPTMTITKESALGLIDVLSDDHIEEINPIYISSIPILKISVEHEGNMVGEELDMIQSNRRAMLSIPFVRYIKQDHWSIDDLGNFVFDLSQWDYSEDILVYPKKEYSFSDHSNQVANLIENGLTITQMRTLKDPVVHRLQELFHLVNTKLNVNMSLLETIIYNITVSKDGTKDLSRGAEEVTLGSRNDIIGDRSLSNLYAFEKQLSKILDPRSFDPTGRPDSCFDVFIDPASAVAQTDT